ncbi:mechanosensitive ion channel protein 9-like isoform X3 [Spinacia oleracea]|uniref:Mechanosensitive ion channel protein 9-like isoform X3 n=1 Tax=Spinacia oleracea TaxID=3562 RepID=A0A9R0J8C6_SPIOL|nr:mechanosensitive ion channel protein 9-like isoform X3 [Spinacia oleracea]
MMSTQQPSKGKITDDSATLPVSNANSHEILPGSPICDTSVNILEDKSVTPPSVLKMNHPPPYQIPEVCSWSSLPYILFGLLFLPFSLTIFLCFATIAATAALPLLVVFYVVTRLFQFTRHGEGYDNATLLKVYIRTWIFLDMLLLLVSAGVFSVIVKHVPLLKHVTLTGLSLTDWIHVYCVIFGIYVFSLFISTFANTTIPLVPLDRRESGVNVSEGVTEIFDCLIFWLAEFEVMKRVPTFKHHKMLGLYSKNWIEASLFILIVYNIISLSTHAIMWLLQKFVCEKLDPGLNEKQTLYLVIEKLMSRKYLVYFANGIKHSMNYIFFSLFLLLVWVLYFGSHLEGTTRAKNVIEYGTWTCICFFICSVLWLIKTCVILSWKARSVYSRLRIKILEGGKQLYFLGIIGRHSYDIFNVLHKETSDTVDLASRGNILTSILCDESDEEFSCLDKSDYVVDSNGKDFSSKRKKVVKDELLIMHQVPTMYDVQEAALYFLNARNDLLNEKYTSDILEQLKSCSEDGNYHSRSTEEYLKRLVEVGNTAHVETQDSPRDTKLGKKVKQEWGYFEDQLHEYTADSLEDSTSSFETSLEIWMERAHNNCLVLANTLSSAEEVVDCLNKIISTLLIAATFILWLLISGLATTKVLVLIASPSIAVTFIFRDVCKTVFYGIVFAYVVHPFDVGDLCFIDENLMEVKTIGIWKTTFTKVSTQEEVIYSNPQLAQKSSINYKTDFNWNDCLEFDADSLEKETIRNLKKEIEQYLEGNKDKFRPGFNCVEVVPAVASGENIKIAVNFRHNVKLKNNTYFQCLKEKRNLRSEIVLYVQNLIDQNKNAGSKSKTSDCAEEKTETSNDSLICK